LGLFFILVKYRLHYFYLKHFQVENIHTLFALLAAELLPICFSSFTISYTFLALSMCLGDIFLMSQCVYKLIFAVDFCFFNLLLNIKYDLYNLIILLKFPLNNRNILNNYIKYI